jgi:hypothetical protein
MMSTRSKIVSLSLLSLVQLTHVQAGTSTPVSSPEVAAATSMDAGAARPCMCLGAHAGSTEPFSVNITVGYDSTFFCRGMDMGDDLWSATATLDWNINQNLVWTLSERYLYVDETEFEENHLYTGLFYKVGALSIGPSARWYHNDKNGMLEDAYDLGLQAVLKAGPVNFSGGYYYETETEGHYFELGASAPIKITENFSLVPAAEISYTDGWMMPGAKGWNTVSLRLSAPIKLCKAATLIPWIGANLPLEALEMHQDNKFVGGVAISATF